MANPLKQQKPVPAKSPPPETHDQTKPVEDKMSPSAQHHMTEAYGKGSGDPKRTAKS